MRYEIVKPSELIAKCSHLFEQAYAEAAIIGHKFKLNDQLYASLEDSSSFGIIAYDGDMIAGYCSVWIVLHQHTSVLMATNDSLFVLPKYRGYLSGQLFIRAEKEAKARGAVAFQWMVPARSSLYRALLVRTPKEDRQWCQVMFQRNFE